MISPRTVRATAHVLAGPVLGLGAGVLLGVLVVLWGAAAWSLGEGPRGARELAYLYGVGVALLLLPFPGIVQAFGTAQRARFRLLLGAPVAAPPRLGASPLRQWRASAFWRQLAYHLLVLTAGTAGAAAVAACWTSPAAVPYAFAHGHPVLGAALVVPAAVLLFAAPATARTVAAADLRLARALLGPSRSEELELRIAELARSRAEVVAATDAERRRIERDLHDGAQQRLVSLAMKLGMARADPDVANDPERARQAIEQAHEEAVQALAELRELVRGLHPAVLDDRGLDAALSGVAARAPLPVDLDVALPARCAPRIEAVAYFVVSEALANVVKHSGAARAEVTARTENDRLHLAVEDDGRGGAVPGEGTGLAGLAQRVAAVDGTLRVASPPGGPTRIEVDLPCEW